MRKADKTGRMSAQETLELWQQYKRTGDQRVRDRLVLTFAPMVKYIVYKKAREIPAIIPMLADGRLHLCGVSVMAKYLKPENAADLLAAATHKRRKEIQILIAERFPQPDVPTRLEPIPSTAPLLPPCGQLAPGRVPELRSAQAGSPAPWIKVAPLSKGKSVLQGTIPDSLREKLLYNRDVRPILAENCFPCHGPDSAARKAKLRLDVREQAIEMGAIAPGKPGDSEGVKRILLKEDDKELMPPAKSHKKLTPAQKDVLKRWVAQGAEYQPHWSFIPPTRPAVPAVKSRLHRARLALREKLGDFFGE